MSAGTITGCGVASFAEQRVKAKTAGTRLNLVSLMDIFTILVFFLMLNTGEVEVLQPDEKVVLPKSYAKLRPDNSPVIKVNADGIYFKEQQVVEAGDSALRDQTIAPLYALLEEQLRSRSKNKGANPQAEPSISIMGDSSVEYALLKKVLNTCAQAGYRDVALAVEYSSRAAIEQPLAGTTGAGA